MSTNSKIVMGIVAHVDTGKTTLSESILYNTGCIRKLGRVDSKDTFLDTDTVEKERGITIYSKDARFDLGNTSVVLIDTPGHVDFSTEMERTLCALDVAVLLISGSSGIQSHTKTLWSLLKSYRIPTFIFVNKMDMPDTDRDRLLNSIRTTFSDSAIDFTCEDINELYENVATCSESLLDKFFTNGKLDSSDISGAIKDRLIFPVYFGSALRNEGVKELLDGLHNYMPLTSYSSSGRFGALCYKITHDPAGKRLTHMKILSGILNIKDMIGEEKVNDIRLYSGDKYTSATQVEAGDICAVAGLSDTHCYDTFGIANGSNAPILAPALSYAVRYPSDCDTGTILKMLRQLEEEDPSLSVDYREQTREIFVSLMGDVHSEILVRNIKDRFNVTVTFTDGKICYKETVSQVAEGVGHFEPLRHYAEVHLRITPLETGSGMQFESDISEDLLARNWQRLIYTHMCEREHRGVLTGSPITDVKLSLVSGRAHIKHTEGGDFRQATYRAIRQGLMQLKSIGACHLLEPYYNYTLVIPDEYVGRAMTDITRMSGTSSIAENDYEHGITVLTGVAPVSTMNGYVKEVTAYTKGTGQLSLALAGYDKCHNEEEVLANNKYDPDADLRNPASSVFCSHGAGTIIPWYDVPAYMHLSYASKDGCFGTDCDGTISDLSEREAYTESESANKERLRRSMNSDISISTEEIDSILHSSTHANENGRQSSYKGISSNMRARTRDNSALAPGKPYKGAPKKPKYILVDGYNVIHANTELSDLAAVNLYSAVGSLNDMLCNYQAMIGIPVMVIYDAYRVKGHPTEEYAYNNISVVYTKEAQTADAYIERYAHENSGKYDITVVTSDGVEQVIVMGKGCTVMSSRECIADINRVTKEFNEQHNVH